MIIWSKYENQEFLKNTIRENYKIAYTTFSNYSGENYWTIYLFVKFTDWQSLDTIGLPESQILG